MLTISVSGPHLWVSKELHQAGSSLPSPLADAYNQIDINTEATTKCKCCTAKCIYECRISKAMICIDTVLYILYCKGFQDELHHCSFINFNRRPRLTVSSGYNKSKISLTLLRRSTGASPVQDSGLSQIFTNCGS